MNRPACKLRMINSNTQCPTEMPMNPSMHQAYQLTRRTFLRGVGVSMALPWLESLPVWGDAVTLQPA